MGFLTNLPKPKAARSYLSLLSRFVEPARGSVLGQAVALGSVQIAIGVTVNALIVAAAGPSRRSSARAPRGSSPGGGSRARSSGPRPPHGDRRAPVRSPLNSSTSERSPSVTAAWRGPTGGRGMPRLGLARRRASPHTRPGMHPAEVFVDALVAGTAEAAAALLAGDAELDDPREGRVVGKPALERWIEGTRRWLTGLDARPVPVRATVQGTSAVVERLLRVRAGGEERQLPVAVATECDAAGRVRAARIYLSFWTLDRAHRVRGPVLPARKDLTLAPPVDRYQEALARGDVDGVLACYQRDATLREPAGEPWVHRGPRGLRRLYGTMFSNGGGLAIEHTNAVDDGIACALEYTLVRWGRTPLPPQAGLVVYERGRTGLIRATRLYDDVDPPRG